MTASVDDDEISDPALQARQAAVLQRKLKLQERVQILEQRKQTLAAKQYELQQWKQRIGQM